MLAALFLSKVIVLCFSKYGNLYCFKFTPSCKEFPLIWMRNIHKICEKHMREELSKDWRRCSWQDIFFLSKSSIFYLNIVFGVFHFGLSQIFLHVESIVGLIKPSLLKSIEHSQFGQTIWNRWNGFFKTHLIKIIYNKYGCCLDK